MKDPVGLRIGSWIKPDNPESWTLREFEAFQEWKEFIQAEDLDLLEAFYRADIPPEEDRRRRNLLKLLLNWPGEVDRANGWKTRRDRRDWRL